MSFILISCGGKFSCQETIDGTRCESVSKVYEREVLGMKEIQEKPTVQQDKVILQKEAVVKSLSLDDTLPIRVSPKVIRIWVAPWEDTDGDLHQVGYIYSEITDKKSRWVFGERHISSKIITAPEIEKK